VGAVALDLAQALRTHSLSFIVAVIAGGALTAAWQIANSKALIRNGSIVARLLDFRLL